MEQLLLVTSCDSPAGIGASLRTHVRTYGCTDGWTRRCDVGNSILDWNKSWFKICSLKCFATCMYYVCCYFARIRFCEYCIGNFRFWVQLWLSDCILISKLRENWGNSNWMCVVIPTYLPSIQFRIRYISVQIWISMWQAGLSFQTNLMPRYCFV